MNFSKKLLADKEALNSMASLREEKTSKEEKYQYLLKRDITKFIFPAYNEKVERNKERRSFRKKLNLLLKNKALALLNTENFVNDLMGFAEIHGLWNVKYNISEFDFYEYFSSPVINAWESRLFYLSLMRWQEESELSNIKFIDVYLPPKFEEKLLALMKNYGLEFFWYESILHLLLTGIWYLPRNSSVIHLHFNTNKIGRSPEILLQISSLTSKKEIEYRWEEIDVLKKKTFPSLKKRTKARNITDAYIAKFDNDYWKVPEAKYKTKAKRKKYIASQKKMLSRAKKDFKDSLSKDGLIPREIREQISIMQEEALESTYYF